MRDSAEVQVRDSVDAHVARWASELPWMDPVKEAIFVRLMIVARHASASQLGLLEADGLRRWQFKILLMLRRCGPPYSASPSQLADLLGLSRGALSARLGPLERDGLIERSTDGGDRRRVHVTLTPAGYDAFEEHAASEETAEVHLLDPLSDPERRTLADLLCKIVAAIESPTGSRP
jgi:DNA-binding MarR family transcriptional regulator